MHRMMKYVALTAALLLAGIGTVTHARAIAQGRGSPIPPVSVPTVSVPTVSVPMVSAPAASTDPCTQPDPLPAPSAFTSGPPGVPGYFDSTFGSGGRVIGPRFTNIAYGSTLSAVAIDHANRIIVVGHRNFPCARNNTTSEMVAARYLPNGSPDASFGMNGLMSIAFGGGRGGANSVVVQADDKVVIGGWAAQTKGTANRPVVIRLNQSGALDTTFGSTGYFWLSLFGTKKNGSIVSLALQQAGSTEKIVAAGWSDYGPRFVLRLNSNGAFDGSFNGTGYSLWNVPNFSAVRIQSVADSPRIVVAGWTRDVQNHYLGAVWRFTDSGALDTSFGGGTGLVQTSFHDEDGTSSLGDNFHSVAFDGAGRIVTVGSKAYFLVPGDVSTTRNQLVLARYDISGTPDPSFGLDGSGRVWVPLSARGNDIGSAVAVQGDGRVIVSGYTYNPSAAAVWRLEADGSIDTSFGNTGSNVDVLATGADSARLGGMAVQPDGRIVCAGTALMPGSPSINYIVLARYWQ